jgi:rod shape-determining protein MreD
MSRFGNEGNVPVARALLLTVTVLVLHVMLFSRFSLFAVRPEPFLLVAVLGALQLGPSGGALVAVFAGLAADVLSSGPIGLWVLVCGVIGLSLGTLRDQLSDQRLRTTTIAAVVGGTLVGLLAYPALAFAVAEQRYPPPAHYALILVIATLWNLLLAAPFSAAVKRLFRPDTRLL